eukprot:scaffold35860_cov129-Isochrysis_galbana.AAC.1
MQVEQELACTEDHSSAASEVESLLRKPAISHKNKLRLVLLYTLRYEREPANRIGQFTDILGQDAKHAVAQVNAPRGRYASLPSPCHTPPACERFTLTASAHARPSML